MLNTVITFIGYIADQLGLLASHIASIIGSLGAMTLSFSGISAWLSTVLPVPKGKGFYYKIYQIINTFGGNVGNATNKKTPKAD